MDESRNPERPVCFRIVFCTADKKRGTGGKCIVFDQGVLIAKRRTSAVASTDGKKRSREKRYPIHVKNQTSGEIRHVHVQLIQEINGHIVL
ncbi:MAG: hypothetical protein ABIN80_23025 [Dyadobacter sp.]|uniref:hypothetical protein n=1 Tax=Dyadobacter sp. TaxID=1914288 RepID=UPI00326558E3